LLAKIRDESFVRRARALVEEYVRRPTVHRHRCGAVPGVWTETGRCQLRGDVDMAFHRGVSMIRGHDHVQRTAAQLPKTFHQLPKRLIDDP